LQTGQDHAIESSSVTSLNAHLVLTKSKEFRKIFCAAYASAGFYSVHLRCQLRFVKLMDLIR